ncbi:MAG: hypothetical protein U5S82_05245 [Gammaproteobacteria bacterium]|nr:hypothetical protein [Gammaproteobacteria bacterium]
MQKAYTKVEPTTFDEFTATRDRLERVIGRLRSPEVSNQLHDELESMIHQEGQELCRLLYQARLDVRSNEEVKREAVTGHDNVGRTYYREGCERQIESMFGEVIYRRKGYSHPQQEVIATVANYLTNHTAMLRYDQFMQQGYPIATGVIEGACRHLIADRFEITGARWSLKTDVGVRSSSQPTHYTLN